MNNSSKISEGLELQDKVLVIEDLEFTPHDYLIPKMLSYCDGNKGIEEIAKILSLDKSVLLFVLSKMRQDGILRKIDT